MPLQLVTPADSYTIYTSLNSTNPGQVKDHSRSLEMEPLDRSYMIYY